MELGTRRILRIREAKTCSAFFFVCLLIGCSANNQSRIYGEIQRQIETEEFQRARQSSQEAWRAAREPEWGWKFKAQYIEVLLSLNELAVASTLLEADIPEQYHALRPRYEYLRGYLLSCRQDQSAATKQVKLAIALARTEKDAPTEGEALNLLAGLDDARAIELLQETVALAEKNHLDILQAETLSNLGSTMHSLGRFAEGVSYLERGAGLARHHQARFLQAQILDNLGHCYLGLGDLDQALKSFENSSALLLPGDPQSVQSDVRMGLGKIASLERDNEKAIKSFRDAFLIVQPDPTLELYVPAAERLASGLLEQYRTAEAEKFNELAFNGLKKSQDAYEWAWYELNRGDIAAQFNQPQKAEALYQKVLTDSTDESVDVRWSAFARLAEIEAAKGNVRAARKNFEGALHTIEENRVQQKGIENQISFLSALMRFYQQYVEFLVKQGKPWEALAVADSSRASLLTQGLESSRDIPDFSARVRTIAQDCDCALLFYWLAPKKSYVWLVTPKTYVLKELPGEQAIADDVKNYSAKIQSGVEDPLTVQNAVGLRLFETLVGPISDQIDKGMRVILVPDGALHGLNFETLLVKGKATHYWLDDVTLTVAPSLRVLLEEKSVAQNSERALIIGDSIYSGDPYEALPESKKEVANLDALFAKGNTTVLTKRDAVPEAYKKARPETFSLIHFSAHVEANERSPLDSAIILSQGEYGKRQLYARDLMQASHLNADLVTISGCNSAGKRPLAGEGMVGFAWAAFQAGARNALTSLWEVDDESTTDLMNNFYIGVRRQKTPYAEALHLAKLQLLSGKYKKPYYWAAFQLYSRNVGDNRKPLLQARR